MLRAALVGASVLIGAAAPEQGLHRFDILSLSPDGAHVASVEGQVPPGGGDPAFESLVIRDTADGARRVVSLPCGETPACVAGWPTWSRDGTRLAFTLPIPGGHSHAIWTVGADGRAPTRLLEVDGTVVMLRYGPGDVLAGLAREGAEKEAGVTKAGVQAVGELGGPPREQRVAILDPQGIRWASPPDLNVYEYDWGPDGGFVGTAAPGDADAHWWQARLFAFDAPDGVARLLFAPPDPALQLADPRVSPDGRMVSFIGGLMSDFSYSGGDAFVLALDAPGALPRNLTPNDAATITSLDWGCRPGVLRAARLAQARTELAELDAAGRSPPVILWSGAETLTGDETQVPFDCRTGGAATIHESFTRPQEIAFAKAGEFHDLTHENDGTVAPVRAVDIGWRNDGWPGQGWLLLPADAAPGARLPLITIVHGGPAWASQPAFLGPGLDRSLLEHGFALFMPNPRGSFGQGQAFTRANVRDLGHGDLRDVLAGIDAAIAAGPVDPSRLGITGSSYGGFLTMWAAGATERFRAGVAEAGISDWLSYAGTAGTVGWLLPYFGASIYDDPAIYARSSPVAHAKDLHMPTLGLVGDADVECPPTQTLEFWHALQAAGAPGEVYVYPSEGHGLRDPAHVADAASRAIAWFERYLR